MKSKLVKHSIFPSYSRIQKELIDESKKEHDEKIQNLEKKIIKMTSNLNFNKQHALLRTKMISQMKKIMDKEEYNQNYDNIEKEKNQLKFIHNQHILLAKNHLKNQSLNFFLEDYKEEQENDYEMYLIFRKNCLKKDLEENANKTKIKQEIHNSKERQQEEEIFKKLYQTEEKQSKPNRNFSAKQPRTKISSNNSKQINDDLPFVLQKVQNLKNTRSQKKIGLPRPKTTNQSSTKTRMKESKIWKQNQDLFEQTENLQIQSFLKNKKLLRSNYSEILKKISHINIIKHRILMKEDEGKE